MADDAILRPGGQRVGNPMLEALKKSKEWLQNME
jgi:hypothetical protein